MAIQRLALAHGREPPLVNGEQPIGSEKREAMGLVRVNWLDVERSNGVAVEVPRLGWLGWSAMLQRFAEEFSGEAFEEVAARCCECDTSDWTDLWSPSSSSGLLINIKQATTNSNETLRKFAKWRLGSYLSPASVRLVFFSLLFFGPIFCVWSSVCVSVHSRRLSTLVQLQRRLVKLNSLKYSQKVILWKTPHRKLGPIHWNHLRSGVSSWSVDSNLVNLLDIFGKSDGGMSVSPKYRTNFSVNDILSPLDETQLKSATSSEYLLHEFRNSENNNSKSGGSAMSAVPVSTPFGVHVPQLGMSVGHHHPSHPHGHSASGSAFSSGSQYVNGASELSSAYGVADVRAPPAPWYSSSTADPRFASDYTLSTGNYLSLSFILL